MTTDGETSHFGKFQMVISLKRVIRSILFLIKRLLIQMALFLVGPNPGW